ncbi:MAG: nuclear transport factor 2 family protein [Betaproteobacteria bacterium]
MNVRPTCTAAPIGPVRPPARRSRRPAIAVAVAVAFALVGCASAPPPGGADLRQQVADTERAFARTMADRDHAAFVTFLSAEAVFFDGPTQLQGRQQVADAWKRYYEKPAAPFSWEPADVEVLASGTLALSSGPVRSPAGRTVATYTSIWRLESPGVWRIVFDKGNDVCDCARAP